MAPRKKPLPPTKTNSREKGTGINLSRAAFDKKQQQHKDAKTVLTQAMREGGKGESGGDSNRLAREGGLADKYDKIRKDAGPHLADWAADKALKEDAATARKAQQKNPVLAKVDHTTGTPNGLKPKPATKGGNRSDAAKKGWATRRKGK